MFSTKTENVSKWLGLNSFRRFKVMGDKLTIIAKKRKQRKKLTNENVKEWLYSYKYILKKFHHLDTLHSTSSSSKEQR